MVFIASLFAGGFCCSLCIVLVAPDLCVGLDSLGCVF